VISSQESVCSWLSFYIFLQYFYIKVWWWSVGTKTCTVLMLTCLPTPWSTVLEKLTGFQLVKKFPTFYRTRRLITAFTIAQPRVPILSQINPVHAPTSWRSFSILSYLCLGLPSCLFPLVFPTKTLYTPLLSPIHATCPTHHILLALITQTILDVAYRLVSSSLCSFLHSPVTLSFLGPNIPYL